MNKEFVIRSEQRVHLSFDDNTKYSIRKLQDFLWDISEGDSIFSLLWQETLQRETQVFEIIPDNTNYKLIIYTNE